MINWDDIKDEVRCRDGVYREDDDLKLLLAWYGRGHMVHVYNSFCKEVALHSTDFYKKHAGRENIIELMDRLVEKKDYSFN